MSSCFPHVGVLQFQVQLGSPRENLERVRAALADAAPVSGTLVVLPELWATGFAYDSVRELAGLTPGLLGELRLLAQSYGAYFAGSLLEEDPDGASPWNTLYLTGPEGVVSSLRKQHMFSYWGEDRHFQPGRINRPLRTPFGLVGGLVCYDLRFPELAREQVFSGCRLVVVSAQWPATRIDHWQTLLKARAIENQVYVAAANSCGPTGKVTMGGHSVVLGPDGGVLAGLEADAGFGQFPLVDNYLEDLRGRFCSMGERPWQRRDADKLMELQALAEHLRGIRHQGSRVAFTNGCFDILHSGHVSYLEQARRSADILVVGLNSDASVRRLKGDGRPINGELERARVLAALGCVDFIVVFAEDTPLEVIRALQPDVLVKGADWPEEQIVGAPEVKAAGGRVERVRFEYDTSTTGLIDRIRMDG